MKHVPPLFLALWFLPSQRCLGIAPMKSNYWRVIYRLKLFLTNQCEENLRFLLAYDDETKFGTLLLFSDSSVEGRSSWYFQEGTRRRHHNRYLVYLVLGYETQLHANNDIRLQVHFSNWTFYNGFGMILQTIGKYCTLQFIKVCFLVLDTTGNSFDMFERFRFLVSVNKKM